MPHFTTKHRYTKAQLWPKVTDDPYGKEIIGAKVEIGVRWEDRQSEMLDPLGNTITVDAAVVVDRDIPVDSIIWKGKDSDLPIDKIPTFNIMQVVATRNTPTVNNRGIRRVVGLKRYSDKLPEMA